MDLLSQHIPTRLQIDPILLIDEVGIRILAEFFIAHGEKFVHGGLFEKDGGSAVEGSDGDRP